MAPEAGGVSWATSPGKMQIGLRPLPKKILLVIGKNSVLNYELGLRLWSFMGSLSPPNSNLLRPLDGNVRRSRIPWVWNRIESDTFYIGINTAWFTHLDTSRQIDKIVQIYNHLIQFSGFWYHISRKMSICYLDVISHNFTVCFCGCERIFGGCIWIYVACSCIAYTIRKKTMDYRTAR